MYERVIQAALRAPWAMMPEKIDAVASVLSARGAGVQWTREEIAARLAILAPGARSAEAFVFDVDAGERVALADYQAAVTNGTSRRQGLVGVLPVVGVLQNRASEMDASSGVVGVNTLAARFRAMVADEAVKGIVLDVDSPGGGVYGIAEFAAEVRAARGQKAILAVANQLAASAAYWLATAADQVYVSPSGQVGSVGVYTMHIDESKAVEAAGLAVTLISAGQYKTEGNPFEPLSEEARAQLEREVAHYYDMFVSDVAAGRGVSVAKVRSDFGQGRVVTARDAVARGMADRVGSIEDALVRLGVGAAPAAAQAEQLTNGVGDSVIRDRRRDLEVLRQRR